MSEVSTGVWEKEAAEKSHLHFYRETFQLYLCWKQQSSFWSPLWFPDKKNNTRYLKRFCVLQKKCIIPCLKGTQTSFESTLYHSSFKRRIVSYKLYLLLAFYLLSIIKNEWSPGLESQAGSVTRWHPLNKFSVKRYLLQILLRKKYKNRIAQLGGSGEEISSQEKVQHFKMHCNLKTANSVLPL